MVYLLSVALRVVLGVRTWPGTRAPPQDALAATQRRNGRAFSSLTARGGGLPVGVIKGRVCLCLSSPWLIPSFERTGRSPLRTVLAPFSAHGSPSLVLFQRRTFRRSAFA